MKSYLKVGALLCMSAVVVFFACRKESKPKKQEVLPVESISKANLGVEADTEFGEVSIRTDKGGNNIILVKDDKGKSKRLYIVQKDGDATVIVNDDIKHAQLVFMQHSVLINSLDDSKRYYFAVDKDEEKIVYKNLPELYKTYFTAKSYGFGLSRTNGTLPESLSLFVTKENPFQALSDFRQVESGVAGAMALLASCNSGGEGASSCSVTGTTGCSVSCKNGYYACCNSGLLGPSCECNRERPQQ